MVDYEDVENMSGGNLAKKTRCRLIPLAVGRNSQSICKGLAISLQQIFFYLNRYYMEHTNIVSSPLVGISGEKLDKEVIKKAVENLVLTPANKRRLKKLDLLHGAGFWSDFGSGFKK